MSHKLTGKHLACTKSSLQLINEVIVPRDRLDLAVSLTPRRLCSIRVTGDDHETKSLESVRDDRALGRPNNVVLLGKNEDHDTDAKHAEAHEVSSPEAFVLLHEWRSEERQTSHVDASVKHHVDPLESDRRIDDDPFTGLCDCGQCHLFAGVLVGNEGCDVRFDATGSESDDNNGSDVATECGTMFNGDGKRSSPKDHKLPTMSVYAISHL